VEELSEVLGFKITFAEFCDLWTCIFLPDPLIGEALLESLASRYRLMLLSNTNPIHFEMVKTNYPLLRHFHDCVLSYEAGAVKPSSKIFQVALQRAQCKPEECFFTDDILINIEAARTPRKPPSSTASASNFPSASGSGHRLSTTSRCSADFFSKCLKLRP